METNSALSGLSNKRKSNMQKKENLWTKFLSEVQSGNRSKLSSGQSLLVLGDNESGKTTLIAKLQGNEDPQKGAGLEYSYIQVRDEYRDEKTHLGVWILDGDPKHSELLEFAINKSNFESTDVILTVSMTSPWAIMDQLHTAASILQEHIDKLEIDAEVFQQYQKKRVAAWQEYTEPGDELDGPPLKKSSHSFEDEENGPLLSLDENILTRNLGLNVIVVITKTDYMSTLEKDFDYREEHFDFIQENVRKFCLQYGASLVYNSVKEDKNCDLLYKFLVHQVYGFPFRTPALVVEKDAVFIPAGWDNEKKISILYENMHSMSPDDYYTDVISKPQITRKSTHREMEVQAEDESAFLSRHFAHGLTPGLPLKIDHNIRHSSPGVQRPGDRKIPSGTNVPNTPITNSVGSNRKVDPSKPSVGSANEGLLANFFNALLSKKTGSPAPSAVRSTDKSSVRSDAAAELDRLTRNKNIGNSPLLSRTLDNIPVASSPGPQSPIIDAEELIANNLFNNSASTILNNDNNSLRSSSEC